MKEEDAGQVSVIIIGPNDGQRGAIGFKDIEYHFKEEQVNISIPVERIDGSDGSIMVEYNIKTNSKYTLSENAEYGRDFIPFGSWTRILHHECDYLKYLAPSISNLDSAQRYISLFPEDGQTNDFFSNTTQWLYQDKFRYGFGCCVPLTAVTPRTYPYQWMPQWSLLKIEYPLDLSFSEAQIVSQNEECSFPFQTACYQILQTHKTSQPKYADMSLKLPLYNNHTWKPKINVVFDEDWIGINPCSGVSFNVVLNHFSVLSTYSTGCYVFN